MSNQQEANEPIGFHYTIDPDLPGMEDFYGNVYEAWIYSRQGESTCDRPPDSLTYTRAGIINRLEVRFFPMPRAEGIFFLMDNAVFSLTTVSYDDNDDKKQRWRRIADILNTRNREQGFAYPDREFQIAEEQKKQRETEAKLESLEQILKTKEQEETKKMEEAKKRKNLLNLPEQEFYDVPFLLEWLKLAGIIITPRAIQEYLQPIRDKKHKRDDPFRPRQRVRHKANLEEARSLLEHFLDWDNKRKK